MRRLVSLIAGLCLLGAAGDAMAQDACILCDSSTGKEGSARPDERPLTIEITTDLSFSRMALTGRGGQGSAVIDPQTGARRVAGNVVALGGMAVRGSGRITGTPGRAVRIDIPHRIVMSAGSGATAELEGVVTDLPAYPVLDSGGVLEFSFGGELRITGDAGGVFRGRIPISVDYN